jgi:hypothetical protein
VTRRQARLGRPNAIPDYALPSVTDRLIAEQEICVAS